MPPGRRRRSRDPEAAAQQEDKREPLGLWTARLDVAGQPSAPDLSIRSGVEGTIHQAVTAAGTRRTRYTGRRKAAFAHVLTATAVNLLRLDAWWTGQPLAPTRTSHLTALDLAI
ncbi:transposase [Streptomyces sp. SAS_260]|uniref:transposase n=1 Tax=Streptomyces sp. SAS_260 TaxID=3412751 RepID=UPI00403C9F50